MNMKISFTSIQALQQELTILLIREFMIISYVLINAFPL